jgi:hypothetical protein
VVGNAAGSATSVPPALLKVNATSSGNVLVWGNNDHGQTTVPAGLNNGNVPGVVENAVGGLAVEPTGSAMEITNQNHQTHAETKPQSAGRSQHQII